MNFIIIEVMMMKTLQVTFDDDLHARAKSAAHRMQVTLGEFVRTAVDAHLRNVEGTATGQKADGGDQ